ncbi:sigma-54 interaction domain-containing protein [Cystobacter ferrugineus]|uniref:AAA family ATPase n=1 Tax=Cystobacter ferrugineus TaxID=83449 RepID=A0A1L9B7L8_9BACT|nr:sigma 54-interacting transcriptional regulator [Cystobacter ferrugineus]OJH38245.1 AAA family ATPase [Cystobacter ferrugineus]
MRKVLVAWVGKTDLRAPTESEVVGAGPIAQALDARAFDEVFVLSDYEERVITPYVKWLRTRTKTRIEVVHERLSGPTEFGEIYEAAVRGVQRALGERPRDVALAFHLSPGTPAMAAVWILLGKTRFPAELIESSRDHGVRTASVPFDIFADFIPDLLRRPDEDLGRLSAGLPPESPEFTSIIHQSHVMKRVVAKARRAAPRSVPVLLEGESGTGKELLARAIHRSSTRRDKEFIAVNCGAIPSDLVESQLFGYEKGAFTGATKQQQGMFEAAHGGTLFLDEVGELPGPAQVKLLRVLQEGELVRVGATKPLRVDVRIIAATNRTLAREIAEGRFREDLFYRLAVAVLHLPPLRERPGDLNLLIDHLLDQINRESAAEPGYKRKNLSVGARNLLLSHSWPGNIRELVNTLRRAAIWSDGDTIRSEDVREALLPVGHERSSDILNRPLGDGLNLPELLASVARHYLRRALDQAHGNKTQAAQLVGLPSYQTLSNWLQRYGVES